MDIYNQIELLKNMQRVRSMEELCAELYTQEKIRGFLHLYIGEEAVATGVISLLRPQDNVSGTYREHAHALLKGVSSKTIMAEMFGKVDGCCRGRGGSMHLYSKDKRFFGGSGIVASGIPQAVGMAFAAKKLKEDRFTVCFFGEGAMAEGAFYESINMASLWQIPILFCCENNFYAMGTALQKSQSQTDLVKKAKAFVIEANSGDGMNIYDVVDKTKNALEYIKNEKRPYFLEFKTYRFKPHSMFDPEFYRDKNEVARWKEKCPIEFLKQDMMNKGILSYEAWEKLLENIQDEMSEAVSFAESSALENIRDLENGVYA